MSDFGASGPFEELYTHFGITAEGVVSAAQAAMAKAAC
jgi:transketolase